MTATREHLDAAVRAAASLALELARRAAAACCCRATAGRSTSIPTWSAWPAAHVRLALVEGAPERQAPALAAGARRGRLFYVAAPAASTGSPPTLVGAAATGSACSCYRRPLADGLPLADVAFEVSGCRGFVARGADPVASQGDVAA